MRKVLDINGKKIGDGYPSFIAAEIGINHNGKLNLAIRLIKAAKEAGADAVKFQKRNLKSLYKKDILKDPNKDSQSTAYLFDIFKRFELTNGELIQLKKFCDHLGIIFFCTPFDITSADFLAQLKIPMYKIASADLTNIPLIHHIIKIKKPMLLSTGMSQMEEVDFTVNYLNKNKAEFALLHCISTYPVSFKDVNLKMINTLKSKYDVPIGYSGHERGVVVSVCSAALGANIIERHLTLNRAFEGPDHNLSLTPAGLKKMIQRIRVAEAAVGTGRKSFTRGEYLTREVFAKSLIARKAIKKGQIIKYELIDIKGPGKGLNPQKINSLIGKKAQRNIEKNDYFYEIDIN